MTSVAEPTRIAPPADITVWQLRENLIDITTALADELAADGDADRLQALTRLYQITRDALAGRDLRGAR